MTAQTAQYPTQSLPKEPLDLPKEPLDLPSPHVASHNDVRTLLSWTAPGRPFRKRGRQYYLTSLLIVFLIELILFLFSQYVLMRLVASLVFVAFALSLVPPKNFHYRISTEGITIEDHFFLWQELYDFYFKNQYNVTVLHIRTHSLLPGELTITLGDMHKDHVKSALLRFLPFREVIKKTFMDKSGDWLARNFPLEKPNSK
jgi:hypothetical protein